ncbi:MAG: polysaccharide deacetylase family protein [Oscillospiraceae bacterium]
MIIIPSVLAVYFGVQSFQNKELAEKYKTRSESTELPKIEYITDVKESDVITYASFEYQLAFPELYVQREEFVTEEEKKPVVYLTFDDGPSQNTIKVLDILKENDIKATFFVVKSNTPEAQAIYKRIVDEGHTIGIHTYSHKYKEIYQSVEAYLSDFEEIYNYVYEVTGVHPEVFRFPGGSINAYNQNLYERLISEMLRRGFVYYDWNVASGDAGGAITSSAIKNAVVTGAQKYQRSIVLLHDSSTKVSTVQALPEIIRQLKETHVFKALDNTVSPVVFTYTE